MTLIDPVFLIRQLSLRVQIEPARGFGSKVSVVLPILRGDRGVAAL